MAELVSDLDGAPASADTAEGGGGGSMGEGLDIGSGSEGIGSSADEVSMVMCFVVGEDWRSV